MSIRNAIVAVAAFGLLVAGCGSGDGDEPSSSGLTKVRAATFGASLTSILEVVAAEQGIMEKHGIDFELQPFNSAADMYPALLGGDLDYVPLAFASAWPLEEQGECFKYMMAEAGSQYSISALAGSDLEAGTPAEVAAELKGKRIGVTARGVPMEKWLTSLLSENGVSDKEVTFVATGSMATGITAIENNQVDAIISWAGWDQAASKPLKELLRLYGPDSPWKDLIQTASAVTCDYAKKNAETTVAICEGMHDAFQFATEPRNDERMGEIVATTLKVASSEADKIWSSYKVILTSPDLTEAAWDAQKPYVTTTKFVPKYADDVVQGCDFS